MNKYLLLLVLPLLSFVVAGCGDGDGDDEDNLFFAPDPCLIPGTWEVVDQGDQQVFEMGCILDITATQIHEGYGGYRGIITTYFLTDDGIPKHDRVFSWSCLEVENNQPLLDAVCQGELDDDNLWADDYHYRIVKLTGTHMWWQVNTDSDNSTIEFKRRGEVEIE